MEFLNEVMTRYPDAISFAPGAVHERFLRDIDVAACVSRYSAHLSGQGLDAAAIRSRLGQYGPSQGIICDLIAAALGHDEGIDVAAEAVLITVGAQEAMLVTLRALIREAGDVLVVADPCYVGIAGAARLLDVPVVPAPGGPAGLTPAALAGLCSAARAQGRRVRVLYVAPDFANPSGDRLSLGARQDLLDTADREDFLIIEDSAYRFTGDGSEWLPSLKALDRRGRVIHVGTLAKVGVPGARVGYAVADQPVRDRDGAVATLAAELARIKSMVTVNTSPISQAVVGGLLLEHGGSLAVLARDKRDFYRNSLRRLLDSLEARLGSAADPVPGLSWNRPQGGFFVCLTLPVPATEALLEISAAQFGVLWTPMTYFQVGDGGCHDLRLSCSYLDPDEIDEGVARLARFARAHAAPDGGPLRGADAACG
jgi:(S)-3,5-dihydroxyphenylglycine transaminase